MERTKTSVAYQVHECHIAKHRQPCTKSNFGDNNTNLYKGRMGKSRFYIGLHLRRKVCEQSRCQSQEDDPNGEGKGRRQKWAHAEQQVSAEMEKLQANHHA